MRATEPAAVRRPVAVDGRLLTVVVLVIAALAWVWVGLLHGPHAGSAGVNHQSDPGGDLPSHDHGAGVPPDSAAHEHSSTTDGPGGTAATTNGTPHWVAGWVVMVVAMMLPPALPLLRVAGRLVAHRRHPRLLVVGTALAFLGVWVVAGLAFAFGDVLLTALAGRVQVLAQHPQLTSGVAAVLAGAYQFSRLKQACLTACRSPLSLAMTTWTGRRSAGWEAAHLGARFGFVCVGCCWALMLLTFTVGIAAMPVMVVVGAVMALERLLPRIRPLVPLVGVQIIALGILIMVGLIPPGLGT